MKKIWFNDNSLAEMLTDNGINLICNENMEITIADEDVEKALELLQDEDSYDYGIEDLESAAEERPVYSVGCSTDEWDETLADGMTYQNALDFFEQLTNDASDERYQTLAKHCTGGCFWVADESDENEIVHVKEFRVEPNEE